MNRRTRGASLACVLAMFLVTASGARAEGAGAGREAAASGRAVRPRTAEQVLPPALSFSELFQAGGSTLTPTARLRSLDGLRVRMQGFMATMESAPKGSFYLTPRPVHCDEAGGGTADLPPTTVRVVVPSAQGQRLPHVPGLIEVTGLLSLGPREDQDGRVFGIHLTLDPAPKASAKAEVKVTKKGESR